MIDQEAWAVVSEAHPSQVGLHDGLIMYCIGFDQQEAFAEVSKRRAAVYLELGKLGSISAEQEQQLLDYRATIRIERVSVKSLG